MAVKIRGAISSALADALGLDVEDLARLHRVGWLPPMAGGAPDDDDDKAKREAEQKAEQEAEAEREAEQEARDDLQHVRVSKAEREAERKRVAAADAILAKERKAEDKRRQEAGKHDEVLAERDREHAEALEQRDARIAELEGEAQHRAQREIAERVAKRLEFRDPEDLWLRVAGSEHAADEKRIEARGKAILKERPDLRAGQAATGAAMNGAGPAGLPDDVTPRERVRGAYAANAHNA